MTILSTCVSLLLPLKMAYAGFCSHTGKQGVVVNFMSIWIIHSTRIPIPRAPRTSANSSYDDKSTHSNHIADNPPTGSPHFR